MQNYLLRVLADKGYEFPNGAVSRAHLYYAWWRPFMTGTKSEITIFCQNRQIEGFGMVPDCEIGRTRQIYVSDMYGTREQIGQMSFHAGRKIFIEQQPHR